jgi:hypothetical protein
MNIFYLDNDPEIAAHYHCDKHVVKMILETAQLLCTAHHELGSGTDEMYKSTHKNHPSAVWVRASVEHYEWAYSLFVSLLEEYTSRYKKEHKTSRLVDVLKEIPYKLQSNGFIHPPQCMPDAYKHKDTVKAYISYYTNEKSAIAKYMYSDTPKFMRD